MTLPGAETMNGGIIGLDFLRSIRRLTGFIPVPLVNNDAVPFTPFVVLLSLLLPPLLLIGLGNSVSLSEGDEWNPLIPFMPLSMWCVIAGVAPFILSLGCAAGLPFRQSHFFFLPSLRRCKTVGLNNKGRKKRPRKQVAVCELSIMTNGGSVR